ncbi:CbiX/SirB N-terminal domain-containing protein [Desulfoluna sp.]|uniref:sirohydrochlorin chelatase n=1 Tax=Desulfoluna sp. TaxID=2045199 RepID=UPI00261886A2|nr:CbiX/SirB N-terminal domain-containing protein [Desulfoluna sp.]
MKVLLIVSHGSRRKDSNDEVRLLAEHVAQNTGPAFEKVCCAFLELTSPMIDTAIVQLADEGATEIVVFPYFLAAGTHVVNDIPRIIEEGRNKFPNISMTVIPHLGAIPGISNLIVSHSERSTSE